MRKNLGVLLSILLLLNVIMPLTLVNNKASAMAYNEPTIVSAEAGSISEQIANLSGPKHNITVAIKAKRLNKETNKDENAFGDYARSHLYEKNPGESTFKKVATGPKYTIMFNGYGYPAVSYSEYKPGSSYYIKVTVSGSNHPLESTNPSHEKDLQTFVAKENIFPVPAGPQGKFFTNGDGTGYVNLNWQSVENATGYKVWVFNGAQYESIDVGNKTSWSTKNNAIWPTTTEISQGKFNIHKDASDLGNELVLDPSLAYRNAGTAYNANKNYYFRISAYNSSGESVYSNDFYKNSMPDLALPDKPEAEAYLSEDSTENTGYIDLQWDPVKNATGYKVWIYNGKSYESIDVGDTTVWSTYSEGLWPTEEEIANGRYKLHFDMEGKDLAIDPSPVYVNSKGNYGTDSKNYWFRISAYNNLGETVYSSFTKPTIIADEVLSEDDIASEEFVEVSDENIIGDNLTREDFKSDQEYEEWLTENGLNDGYEALKGKGWQIPRKNARTKKVTKKNGDVARYVEQTLAKEFKWIYIRNGHLANKSHPVTKVPFDKYGFPRFNAVGKVILKQEYWKSKSETQNKHCNINLALAAETNPALKKKFTKQQLFTMKKGNTPKGYIWHHHQQRGLMQLVNKDDHENTGHTGGKSIWGRK